MALYIDVTIGFSKTTQSVNESEPSVSVCVEILQGDPVPDKAIAFSLDFMDDTATRNLLCSRE